MKLPDALAGRPGVWLAVAIALFYLALTPWTSLWDRDEPRFAQATVEMLASGNYLYPTFNAELRPHKPILIYWLMSLSAHGFGPTELAFRFWSPVGMATAALFTFMIARRLRSARTGLVAMLLLALNPLAALEAVAATTDALLLAAITGSLAAFVSIRTERPRIGNVSGLVAGLTLAQLLKGPVGLAVPLAVMAGAMLGRGNAGTARALSWAWVLDPLILFTLAVTTLPHRVLPIWPALAIAVAAPLAERASSLSAPWASRWLKAGRWVELVALCRACGT